MSWINANWRAEATFAAQLVKLDAYLVEIDAKITANVSKASNSRQSDPLLTLRAQLLDERQRIAQLAARQNNGGIRRGRFAG